MFLFFWCRFMMGFLIPLSGFSADLAPSALERARQPRLLLQQTHFPHEPTPISPPPPPPFLFSSFRPTKKKTNVQKDMT